MTDFAFVTDFGSPSAASGAFTVGTGRDVQFIEFQFPSASAGAVLAELDLELPADARIETGYFEIGADPVDPAVISTVATVREGSPVSIDSQGAATVDFGRLVTTAGLVSTGLLTGNFLSIDATYRWTGSDWRFIARSGSFAEVATERLLFESNSSSSTQIVSRLNSGSIGISLPQTPSGLELLIDGTTSWSERQGSSPISFPVSPPTHRVSYAVDRTTVLRDAFTRAVAKDGVNKVRIGLRSTSPGSLTLVPHVGALRVYTHTFSPDGPQRSFDLPEEGQFDTNISPPDAADVREVAALVRGTFGPSRVQPAVGPPLTGAAELTMAPGRPLLIGLPSTTVSRFGKLSGVRVNVSAGGTSGCEVSGRLLASVNQIPGDPVPAGELAAVTMNGGDSGWRTLALAAAIEVPFDAEAAAAHVAHPDQVAAPAVAAWLELQLGYGEAVVAMTSSPPDDLVAAGAPVVRRLPGGGTKALTTINGLGALYAAMRIVGLPDRDRPIAAITLAVVGPSDVVGVNPTADSVHALLTLAAPFVVVDPAGPRPARLRPVLPRPVLPRPVLLRAVANTSGSLVLDTIQVTYREGGP